MPRRGANAGALIGPRQMMPVPDAPGWSTVAEVFSSLADLPLFALTVRMSAVAVFVVIVALLSERVGPFFGAMVASLPIYTGPVYLFLAIDHPPEYLARVAVGSLAACAVTPVFLLVYALMARAGHAMAPSLLAGIGSWIACAVFVQLYDWSLIEALLFAIPIYSVALLLSHHFKDAVALKRSDRSWLDLAVRVLLVTSVVGLVNALSPFVPAKLTGILSIMPTVTTSLILVLHGRIGGPATAALFAHSVGGLVGMMLAVMLVGLTVVPWGPAISLPLALALCIGWNLMLIGLKHGRAMFNRPPSSNTPHLPASDRTR